MPLLFLVAVSLRYGFDTPALFDSFQAELLNRGHAILRPLTTGLIVLGPPLAFLVTSPAPAACRGDVESWAMKSPAGATPTSSPPASPNVRPGAGPGPWSPERG